MHAVDRLLPDVRARIESNLLVGVQRELTYQLGDGSYSAFGEQDGEGSMWLTAFVLQVRGRARPSGPEETWRRPYSFEAAGPLAE